MAEQVPPPAAPPPADMSGRPGPVNDTSKILAALSYPLWFPVAIIAFLIEPYKNEKFVKFHAIQGLALGLAIWVIGFVTSFFLIGFFVYLIGFVYQIILGIKAWNGEYVEVPVVFGMIKGQVGE